MGISGSVLIFSFQTGYFHFSYFSYQGITGPFSF